jgi:hypothetical protein
MAKTIGFQHSGLKYCPLCRKVYYLKGDCDCDDITIDVGIYKEEK